MRDRAGIVLAASVAVLVLLSVVAGVVSANRPGPQLPEGSPEATVQDYIAAVVDGDLDAAAEHLDPDGECTVEDLENNHGGTTARVVLRDSEVDGDEADVRVEFVHDGGGVLGGDEWREEHRYDLRRQGERWVITGEPWPVFFCEEPARP